MNDVDKKWGLSDLGEKAAGTSDLGLIFEILKNLWDPQTKPDGYVSLGIAENALMHDTLVDYIQKHINVAPRLLTYGDGGMGSVRLRTALARFLTRHLKSVKEINADHVIITNGCSPAIEHCSYLLANPGDGFLLGQPYYGTFMSDVEFRPKTRVVPVAFGEIDPVGLDAVKCYEEALTKAESKGTRIKGLILCNPHNPLGRCYSREVIIELMKLCQKHHMHFISDEIYALSVWKNVEDTTPPPVAFVSTLSIDTTGIIDPHLVHLIWGLSKDFGANGLRIGTLISQANTAFIEGLQMLSFYSYASGLTDEVTATLLEDDEFTDQYIKDNQRKLSEKYSQCVRFLRQHKISYTPGANAAFFLWVDLGKAWRDRHPDRTIEGDMYKTLMDALLEEKVFLASGLGFGSEKPGWFRIVFSQHEDYLAEGLRRVVAALDK